MNELHSLCITDLKTKRQPPAEMLVRLALICLLLTDLIWVTPSWKLLANVLPIQ